ncbi:3-oxoacyl-ACP reductase family protein [Candidatus Omnitrophota bacterium]
MTVQGKIAIVTGASKGIGRSICKELAKEGAHVVVNYNSDRQGAEQTAQEVKKLNRKALVVQADVSNLEAVKAMIKRTKDEFERIDILINNAGVMPEKYLFRMTDKEWLRCMDVNINGTYYCTRNCIVQMLRQQHGRVVNIVSISGLFGNPGQVAYSTSKAAIVGFTRTLAKEVVRKHITINAIAPGYIDTLLSEDFIKKNKETLEKIIPAGRIGQPEEIARLAVFLSSDKASYINGQVIVADGGLLI